MKIIFKKSICLALCAVLALSCITFTGFASDDTELINIVNSTLESFNGVYSHSNFSFVDWASARCGFSDKRNILTNTDSNAELVFAAGNDRAIKTAEFKFTIHKDDSWMISQSVHLTNVAQYSTDGVSYTSIVPDTTVEGDITYDGTTPHRNYTLTYSFEADDIRFVKLRCFSIKTNRFFPHNVKLDGIDTRGELLLDDAFTNTLNVKTVKGFKKTHTTANCGIDGKIVAYRSGSDEAYAIYDLNKYKSVKKAEFDVTVGNNVRWQITDSGALDSFLQYSTDGVTYLEAKDADNYKATYTFLHSKNNHSTYTLAFNVPAGAKYVKFNATKFADWQFYLHGIRFYGFEYTENYTPAQLTPPAGHNIVWGDYGWAGDKFAHEMVGFSTHSYIGYKVGPDKRNILYKDASNGASYVVYKAPNNGTFSMVDFNVTVASFDDCCKITNPDALENNLYASADGVSYTPVKNVQTQPVYTAVETGGDGSQLPYTTINIKALLPDGTKYVKIDASEFANWRFMYTDVAFYGANPVHDYANGPSLYKTYEPYFTMGVAIEPDQLNIYNDIIETQYNEIVIENMFKANVIHPKEDEYQWIYIDKIIEYAQAHGKKVRGHGLVYEKTMPGWMFVDENGNQASKELVLQRLEEHVRTVVRRYKGKIWCYDLVNENFGHTGWDTRELSEIVGVDEYTRKVFQWAHEEDPDAILILNDNYYDIETKRNLIYNYVEGLVEDGVPIHGIGFQDHHFIDTDPKAVDATLTLFSKIPNFKLFVTELDIRSNNTETSASLWPDFMMDEVKEVVARKYASMMDVYRKHADRIEGISFWNVCDKVSWTNSGGMNHPATPFGFSGEPNPAYYSILDIAGKLPRWEGGTKMPLIRNNNYKIDSNLNTITVSSESTGDVVLSLISKSEDKMVSDLTSANSAVTANDFVFPSWNAYSRCGFSSARNIYMANSNAASLVFNAGDTGANYAEFNITAHRDNRWRFTDEGNIGNLIKFSNDGAAWTNATSHNTSFSLISGPVSDKGTTDGTTPWYTYKIKVNLDAPVKYIKIDASNHGVSGMYVHYAKLTLNTGAKTESITANGKWTHTMNIPAIEGFDGTTSPDYVLTVTDSTGSKTDKFTYYRTDIRSRDYRIIDNLDDTTKAYRVLRCKFETGGSDYNNDNSVLKPLNFWNTANIGAGEVVYKVEDGFKLNSLVLNMVTSYLGQKFKVYTSADDVNYTEASVSWDYVWSNYSRYVQYKGTLSGVNESVRFIKIDLGTRTSDALKDALTDVTLNLTKLGLKLDDVHLKVNGNKTDKLSSGTVEASCRVTNASGDSKNIAMVLCIYNSDGLVVAKFDSGLCANGNYSDYTATIENYTYTEGDYCKILFIEDFTTLNPLFDIQTY